MPHSLLEQIENCLKTIPHAKYPSHSRIHRIKNFSDCSNRHCIYIKRDDELGFGLSGSKVRKYLTLIPFLVNSGFKEAVLIGSLNSNHILSLIQLIIENSIQPKLFLRGDPKRPFCGNGLYTHLFVKGECIKWFSKTDWKNVENEANEYVRSLPYKSIVVPEGGNLTQSLYGALSLPLDIIKNEKEHDLEFDRIFIDSGTGLMAIALILGFAFLKKKSRIQVLLIAGNETDFLRNLKNHFDFFTRWMPCEIPFPTNFELHKVEKNNGFGKTNPSLFKFIGYIAKTEGFLTDPIYSAKLLIESFEIIEKRFLHERVLIMHSGGAMTLAGFQDKIRK